MIRPKSNKHKLFREMFSNRPFCHDGNAVADAVQYGGHLPQMAMEHLKCG